ncbi:tubulin-specific chaperone D-like [Hyperolius riggenbachi]|uniref:tubulin-specific chaperone D-like n=1 Tax=Hyperolius riggenbachi TaxID=752182 RepID=UPI0035A30CD9
MAADSAERKEDGSLEIVSSGNILGSFTEHKEARDLIVNLQMSCMSREVCAQRFIVIMDNYQEQPHLLDPHLGLRIQACCMQELCQGPGIVQVLRPGKHEQQQQHKAHTKQQNKVLPCRAHYVL